MAQVTDTCNFVDKQGHTYIEGGALGLPRLKTSHDHAHYHNLICIMYLEMSWAYKTRVFYSGISITGSSDINMTLTVCIIQCVSIDYIR